MFWASKDTKHKCTWTRRGPKRGRITSERQAEAERDADVVAAALRAASHRQAVRPTPTKTPCVKTCQLGDKTNTWKTETAPCPKTKPVPCVGTRIDVYWKDDDEWYPGEVVEMVPCEEGEDKQRIRYDDGEEEVLYLTGERWRKEQIRVQITEAQLRKYTKELDKKLTRSLRKDKDEDRSFSATRRRDDDEEAERRGKPSYLHLDPHDATQWAGFERVTPHTRTPEVLRNAPLFDVEMITDPPSYTGDGETC